MSVPPDGELQERACFPTTGSSSAVPQVPLTIPLCMLYYQIHDRDYFAVTWLLSIPQTVLSSFPLLQQRRSKSILSAPFASILTYGSLQHHFGDPALVLLLLDKSHSIIVHRSVIVKKSEYCAAALRTRGTFSSSSELLRFGSFNSTAPAVAEFFVYTPQPNRFKKTLKS